MPSRCRGAHRFNYPPVLETRRSFSRRTVSTEPCALRSAATLLRRRPRSPSPSATSHPIPRRLLHSDTRTIDPTPPRASDQSHPTPSRANLLKTSRHYGNPHAGFVSYIFFSFFFHPSVSRVFLIERELFYFLYFYLFWF